MIYCVEQCCAHCQLRTQTQLLSAFESAIAASWIAPPLRLISEQCTESDGAFLDKSLGLWDLADV
jgi:hypothetical protein